MWITFSKLSFKFFKRSLEPLVSYFENLKPDLQKSGIPLSLSEYVYAMIFISLLIFIFEFPLLAFISALFIPLLLAFIFSFTITIFMCLLIFFVFYSYPSLIVRRKRKEIDSSLPFATTYLATIASSGAPPTILFKILSQFEEYGEISKEARKIYRDIEFFGVDLLQAMRKAAARTPSALFKELLWGMTSVISTGSNLSTYLRGKSNGFMQEHRRRLEEFSRTLSLLIEIYLTLIIVGSIFFVIMTAIMSVFSAGATNIFLSFLQFIIIFLVLPFVSVGFIFLLKSLSPNM